MTVQDDAVIEGIVEEYGYNLIFYDFEVFAYDWMMTAYSEKDGWKIIINNPSKLRDYFEEHKEDSIFVGYNSSNYDAYIVQAILTNMNPKELSDYIIKGEQGWKFARFGEIPFYNYDTMVAMASLKRCEGAMGSSIEESNVDFNLKRELTSEEIDETVKYCKHDVEQTRQVFARTIDNFTSKMSLIKTFDLPMSSINKTDQQLVSGILECEPQQFTDDMDYYIPECLKLTKPEYKEVLNWYIKQKTDGVKDENGSKDVICSGVEHSFAWGGVHGARPKYHFQRKGCIVNLDVSSYYPSMMIVFDLLSRCVKHPEKFKEIYHDRLEFKRIKDPRAKPYKIIINSMYGASGMRGGKMYDARNRNAVCVSGQLLLLDLIEKMENANIPGYELIQSNTDGIMFAVATPEDVPKAQAVADEWMERTGLVLETDCYDEIWQKDVSNYYMIMTDDKGHIHEKSKGAVLSEPTVWSNNYKAVIDAVKAYMCYKTPIRESLAKHTKLVDFQYVVKLNKQYDFAVMETANGYTALSGRTFRLFAMKSRGIHTIKAVKGEWKQSDNVITRTAKVSGAPNDNIVVNEDIENALVKDYNIDMKYYIDMAEGILKDFCAKEEKKYTLADFF